MSSIKMRWRRNVISYTYACPTLPGSLWSSGDSWSTLYSIVGTFGGGGIYGTGFSTITISGLTAGTCVAQPANRTAQNMIASFMAFLYCLYVGAALIIYLIVSSHVAGAGRDIMSRKRLFNACVCWSV